MITKLNTTHDRVSLKIKGDNGQTMTLSVGRNGENISASPSIGEAAIRRIFGAFCNDKDKNTRTIGEKMIAWQGKADAAESFAVFAATV